MHAFLVEHSAAGGCSSSNPMVEPQCIAMALSSAGRPATWTRKHTSLLDEQYEAQHQRPALDHNVPHSLPAPAPAACSHRPPAGQPALQPHACAHVACGGWLVMWATLEGCCRPAGSGCCPSRSLSATGTPMEMGCSPCAAGRRSAGPPCLPDARWSPCSCMPTDVSMPSCAKM